MTEVIQLEYPIESIAVVSLEDREHGNTFTPSFVQGVLRRFREIKENPLVKVVVVHGYDSLFCAGGTKDELIGILEKRIHFNDLPFYKSLLDCEVPVISAMQGHALGGGLIFGLYGDVIIMAEESFYAASFMKYGFTPGMGATYLLPKKLGVPLAHEMMFTANRYHGGELKLRGASPKTVKRNEVIPLALKMARELADKPLLSLKLLKQHLNQDLRRDLPSIIAQELKLHEMTFSQPEVRNRIETLFDI